MRRRVRVEPSGLEFEMHAGETIMGAATRLGYRWPTVCGGQADCGVCALEVMDAPVPLPPPSAVEQERLDALPETRRYPDRRYRLACQLQAPAGFDILVVHKRGVASIA